MEKIVLRFINTLTKIFYSHAWAVIPTLVLNWTIALTLAYVAENTTGVISVITLIFAMVFMFVITAYIGFANIEARWQRKAD